MAKRSKAEAFKYQRVDLARDDSSDESDDLDRVLGPPSRPLSKKGIGNDRGRCCRRICVIFTVFFVLAGLATALVLSIYVFPTGLKEALFKGAHNGFANNTDYDDANTTETTIMVNVTENQDMVSEITTKLPEIIATTTSRSGSGRGKNKNKNKEDFQNNEFDSKDTFNELFKNDIDKRQNEDFFGEKDQDFQDKYDYNTIEYFNDKNAFNGQGQDWTDGEYLGYEDDPNDMYFEDPGVVLPLNHSHSPESWSPTFIAETDPPPVKRNKKVKHNKIVQDDPIEDLEQIANEAKNLDTTTIKINEDENLEQNPEVNDTITVDPTSSTSWTKHVWVIIELILRFL